MVYTLKTVKIVSVGHMLVHFNYSSLNRMRGLNLNRLKMYVSEINQNVFTL